MDPYFGTVSGLLNMTTSVKTTFNKTFYGTVEWNKKYDVRKSE